MEVTGGEGFKKLLITAELAVLVVGSERAYSNRQHIGPCLFRTEDEARTEQRL